MNISVRSEITPLKGVIVHRPGVEHLYMSPDNIIEWTLGDDELLHNPDYLLFDDLIQQDRAANEHDHLSSVLAHFTGENNCFQFSQLLKDVLDISNARETILNQCNNLETDSYDHPLTDAQFDELKKMTVDNLLHVLLTGEVAEEPGKKYFKYPIPNLIFTRDIAVAVGNTLILTWGRYRVRKRENILTKFVFKHHPLFINAEVYDFHESHPNLSVEGGDIVVFGEGIICIGMSERTPKETVDALLPTFFAQGFKTIYAVDLPKVRSLMHLDTIFNRINVDEVLVYPPLFIDGTYKNKTITTYRISEGQSINDVKPSTKTLLEIMSDDGVHLTPIKCGGENALQQDREQWTVGANAVAIRPGTIIGYERNVFTLEALISAGYTVVNSSDFLNNPTQYTALDKLMITINGSELSRGRGGARCLTLPLLREAS